MLNCLKPNINYYNYYYVLQRGNEDKVNQRNLTHDMFATDITVLLFCIAATTIKVIMENIHYSNITKVPSDLIQTSFL